MTGTLTRVRSFDRPVQLLLVNQLTINVGFYMLMPYLAKHLSVELALAAWLVGLILGVRNLSQQGMFFLGGSLADRLGYKPMILTGLALRTVGFVLLGFVTTLPLLITATALVGVAGALFNPAARAYLAVEAGERRVEAFALFNVFYQAGILAGPLIGMALAGFSFRVVCVTAATLFALLAIVQFRALPARRGTRADSGQTMRDGWRRALSNRGFLLFSLAMIGSYVLNFQVYLGLPLEVHRTTGGQLGIMLVFTVSGLVTIAGQVQVTTWAVARWTPTQAISRGLALMGVAFLPLAVTAPLTPTQTVTGLVAQLAVITPVLLTTVLLAVATMIVYPFEMDSIVTLGHGHAVGTYYGLYQTMAGIGIAVGNLATGAALDITDRAGLSALPWLALTALGLCCAVAIHRLDRAGRLHRPLAADATASPLPAAPVRRRDR